MVNILQQSIREDNRYDISLSVILLFAVAVRVQCALCNYIIVCFISCKVFFLYIPEQKTFHNSSCLEKFINIGIQKLEWPL